MAEGHDRYMELLFEQIRHVEYPSTEMLDRVEASFETREQVREYLELLYEKVEACQYPSKQLLDRIERLVHLG
jgi:hypothetical protein